MHGSVYFRLPDDAAFFAVIRGRLRHATGRLFFAESDLFDARDQLLGHGTGVFTRSSATKTCRHGPPLPVNGAGDA